MNSNHTPRLLVVDDDPGVISAYRLVLEGNESAPSARQLFSLDRLEDELFGAPEPAKPEWRITFVDQGEDAVEAVRMAVEAGDRYTAMFLDIRMPPGLDGYDVAELVRKLDPDLHIVIVSGYSDYGFEDFVGIAGPETLLTYLPKPVWPDELRAVARELANKQMAVLPFPG
jgi:CheY-like chemotaxis protein